MKVLLQHRQNGCYLHSDGTRWTRESPEARQFESTTDAVQLCMRERLSQVDILLKFEQDRHDIRLSPPENPEQLRLHIPAMYMS